MIDIRPYSTIRLVCNAIKWDCSSASRYEELKNTCLGIGRYTFATQF